MYLTRTLILISALTGATACAVGTPLKTLSGYGDTPPSTLIVAVTEATYDPGLKSRSRFWRYNRTVVDTLPEQSGLLAYALRRELLGNRAWTMTVWKDETSLQGFFWGEEHQAAMTKAKSALRGARFARLQITPADLDTLDWSQALTALAEQRDPAALANR